MKPEEQRIAIATACGWTEISRRCMWGLPPDTEDDGTEDALKTLPEYTTCLNAMHEAEKVLFQRCDWSSCAYEQRLKDMTSLWCWRATATQRAEAFLKTLKLWQP